jgi:hypothetical protein
MVLVTGPTGTAKTTTLYTGLLKLNSIARNIITVEDPIEYQLTGINQIQVKPQIGLNFASLLRSILRHDPDVIMIGEIRYTLYHATDGEQARSLESILVEAGVDHRLWYGLGLHREPYFADAPHDPLPGFDVLGRAAHGTGSGRRRDRAHCWQHSASRVASAMLHHAWQFAEALGEWDCSS